MDTPRARPISSPRCSRHSVRAPWAVGAPLLLAAAIALAAPGLAVGATITVNTTVDEVASDGHCSLREAISAANGDSTGPGGDCARGSAADTVSIPSGHFTLSIPGANEDANATGDLDILGADVTIAGAGAGATTIDANGIDRVLEVRPGRVATIQGVTITGGQAPDGRNGFDFTGVSPGADARGGDGGDGASGGGIFNNGGSLTITASVISGNAAGSGGGGGRARAGDGSSGPTGGQGGVGWAGAGGRGGEGGGIYTTGVLRLTRSRVAGNTAGAGGNGGSGVGGNGGSGSTGNGGFGGDGNGGHGGQGGSGGGIAEASGGSLTIDESSIAANATGAGGSGGQGQGGTGGGSGGTSAHAGGGGTGSGGFPGAGGGGGGISAQDPIAITRTLISGNSAGAGGDGGSGIGGPGGPTTGSSAQSGNGGLGQGAGGAPGDLGGGLVAPGGSIVNLTLDGNRTGAGGAGGDGSGGKGGNAVNEGGDGGPGAAGSGGRGGPGGGVANQGNGALTARQLTISSNVLGGGGLVGNAHGGDPGIGGASSGSPGPASGGLRGKAGTGGAVWTSSNTTLANSIVAGNAVPGCDGFGSVIDGGHDISFGDPSCPGADVDPKLGVLAGNGGPTKTRALGPSSAAIDAVPASGAGCAATDQRGVKRPNGAACDIGAYEHAPPTVTTGAATGIATTAGTFHGYLDPNARTMSYHFQYGTTTSYGSTTPTRTRAAGVSTVAVAAIVGGLKPATTYHYRLVATNTDGASRGHDRTFKTAAVPPPNTELTQATISGRRHLATFRFAGSGGVAPLRFRCKLDGSGFKACSSPTVYRWLKNGTHRFEVEAVDSRGEADPTPAAKRFRISSTPGTRSKHRPTARR